MIEINCSNNLIISDYSVYIQVIQKLLVSEEYFGEEVDAVRGNFVNNFYKILQTALNYSLELQDLESLYNKSKNKPESQIDMTDLLERKLENQSTYILVNYYYANFIMALSESAVSKRRFKELLERLRLGEDVFTRTLENYKEFQRIAVQS